MSLQKSKGTTIAEQFLASLCEKTFLGLWTFANVYRDQASGPRSTDGKELCDVLAICGSDVLLFADKSCAYPSTGNPLTDWQRWYKRSILAASRQLRGAERWIREHPDRLFINHECTQRLPQPIPMATQIRVSRVVVAHGARPRCMATLGGSGSLEIEVRAPAHSNVLESPTPRPFRICLAAGEEIVHVFDEVTLPRVLEEVDTVADFLTYLQWKERLAQSGRLELAAGEEEILAIFLRCRMRSGKLVPDLPPDGERLVIPSGFWSDYRQSPEYTRKRSADQNSYLWDRIISEFTGHACAGTLCEQDVSLQDTEYLLRHLARESRLDRRVLANALLQLWSKVGDNQCAFRQITSDADKDKLYVFLLLPDHGRGEEKYRSIRRAYLDAYTALVHADFKGRRRVIGIATGTREHAGQSYDIAMRDKVEWTSELQTEADMLRQKTGLRKPENLSASRVNDCEYRPVGAEEAYFRSMANAPNEQNTFD